MSNLIYKKMSEVMSEIGFIGKDKTNSAQGFKFRGIDQFINTLYPALIKHGVFITPRCTKEEHQLVEVVRSSGKAGIDKHVSIQMEYDFYAEDGSKVTVGPIPSEGLDSGDKATNKALSAALKYALIQTFSVPTEDMEEADKDSPVISPKDAPAVKPQRVEQKAVTTTAGVPQSVKMPEEKAKPKFVREQPKQDTKPAAPVATDTTQW